MLYQSSPRRRKTRVRIGKRHQGLKNLAPRSGVHLQNLQRKGIFQRGIWRQRFQRPHRTNSRCLTWWDRPKQ